MKIVIVGLGYVGVTAAACLASEGHTVVGVDVNDEKVARVNAGSSPITEPGVDELISRAVADGLLTATASIPPLDGVQAVIVCVGTPSAADGSHNMGYVAESARQIARTLRQAPPGHRVSVAFRSTFRPGTMDDLIEPIFRAELGVEFDSKAELVYNPEFLRESTAVRDYFDPPKIVFGTRDAQPSITMGALHRRIDAKQFVTNYRESEITKFVDNTWHAVKVAFANEVGRICDAYGVDATVAHAIFASDTKLNISAYYTRPGGAFGGSCLPKDVRAMQHIAQRADIDVPLIESLLETNSVHQDFQLDRVRRAVPAASRILVAGLAFKAGTDDMRESPNVRLVAALLSDGYPVRVFDPGVESSALVGQNLGYVLTELPRLRELLISADDFRASDFDLIVANNDVVELLRVESTPVLDLQRITR